MEVFSEIAGIELLIIEEQTRVWDYKDKLHASVAYQHLFDYEM